MLRAQRCTHERFLTTDNAFATVPVIESSCVPLLKLWFWFILENFCTHFFFSRKTHKRLTFLFVVAREIPLLGAKILLSNFPFYKIVFPTRHRAFLLFREFTYTRIESATIRASIYTYIYIFQDAREYCEKKIGNAICNARGRMTGRR